MAQFDNLDQQTLQQAAYTLSWVRIGEQVIINVFSALALAVLSVGSALVLLLYQRLTSYIVVPTNVLMAVVFLSLGALVMLLILALGIYLIFSRGMQQSRPFAYAVLLGILGYAVFSGGALETLRKAFTSAATTESKNATTPPPA